MSGLPHFLRLFRLTTIGALAAVMMMKGVGMLLPASEWLTWVSQVRKPPYGERVADIFVADRGLRINLTHHPNSDTAPTWSASRRLAWLSNRDGDTEIYVRTGTQTLQLSRNDQPDFAPSWSADGLLTWVGRDAQREQVVYVWDGAAVRAVGSSTVIQEGSLAWFSDGRLGWLALQGAESTMVVWDGAQTHPYPFASDPLVTMSWSADGRLAWVARGPLDERSLYVLDVGGGTSPVLLSRAAWISDTIAWAPDGRLAWGEVSPTQEYRIIIHGAEEIVTLPVEIFVRSLAWSRDGRLAWMDIVNQTAHRITVWDGHTTTIVQEGMPNISAPRWSRSGRLTWAVNAVSMSHLYIWDGQRAQHVGSVENRVTGPNWVQGAP